MSDFIESEHPRDENGKFTDKAGQSEQISDSNSSDGAGGVHEATPAERERLREMGMSERITEHEISVVLGKEYKGVKGQAAIEKLLRERQGHVKGAFHRDDIGDIDLLWGNERLGLQHIISQREAQGIEIKDFLSDIAEVIEGGDFYQKSERGNFEFIRKGKMAIIAPEYRGKKLTFVLTAYKTRKKAPL